MNINNTNKKVTNIDSKCKERRINMVRNSNMIDAHINSTVENVFMISQGTVATVCR